MRTGVTHEQADQVLTKRRFGAMFMTIDNTKSPNLLYLSSMGIVATRQALDEKMDKSKQIGNLIDGESSEDDANAGNS